MCFSSVTCDFCLSVRQLHREFLRAGSNVMQTFTFYASDDKLENRGNKLTFTVSHTLFIHSHTHEFHELMLNVAQTPTSDKNLKTLVMFAHHNAI